jgi:hypothetical protein
MNSDLLNKTLKWLDYNRYTALSLILFVVVLAGVVSFVGCQSTTTALTPQANGSFVKVDRSEFNRQAATVDKELAVKRIELDAQVAAFNKEVDAFNIQVQAGIAELDKQDAFRQEIVNTVGLVATQAAQSGLNPVSLIPIGIGLMGTALGLGAAADNRRKDTVIAQLKDTKIAAGAT